MGERKRSTAIQREREREIEIAKELERERNRSVLCAVSFFIHNVFRLSERIMNEMSLTKSSVDRIGWGESIFYSWTIARITHYTDDWEEWGFVGQDIVVVLWNSPIMKTWHFLERIFVSSRSLQASDMICN